jgi:hypothetical protein
MQQQEKFRCLAVSGCNYKKPETKRNIKCFSVIMKNPNGLITEHKNLKTPPANRATWNEQRESQIARMRH